MADKNVQIHLAKWVLPGSRPVIEGGGIAIEKGKIAAVAQKKDLLRRFLHGKAEITDHGDSILMPCLVNVHCHLEFSFARALIPEKLGFANWLRKAMALKYEWAGDKDEAIKNAALKALKQMVAEGISAIGDVGGGHIGPRALNALDMDGFCALFFREIIHPLPEELELPKLATRPVNICARDAYSPHAIYTCSRQALQGIKRWCRSQGLPFSIHCSESPEEAEFVKGASGPLADILEERGRRVDEFFTPSRSSVSLLDEIGVLDSSTICVHCAHIDDKDIEILSERDCHVCLCPRSNEYIGSGNAPVEKIFSTLAHRVCIGTDSLASNRDLSIFKEIKKIMDMAPGICPEDIFRAATINGASALGLSGQLGCLEPGRMASFLVLEGGPRDKRHIYEYICSTPERYRHVNLCQQ